MTIDLITLGCSKNLVDSETVLKQLEAVGFDCTHDSQNPKGEIVVINTCGFIQDAKEESIEKILEFAEAKTDGRVEEIYVMGCLSGRYMEDLQKEIPEVDKFYGKFDYKQLVKDLAEKHGGKSTGSSIGCYQDVVGRHITTPSHYAYLKISEGCDRHCAYCAIPIMTGKHQSRKQEDIIAEVKELVKEGVKEFNVIAQELTYYGIDIDGKQHIAELVEAISDVEGVEWIRLHYAYPTHFPMDLLRVIRERDNVCKYMDIALQHISDNMLTKMRRNISKQDTLNLIAAMRKEVPGICLRTTLMVGFPGETEQDFQELMDFTREVKFDRMGAFAYSEEDGTYSADNYEDDVPEEAKQERLDQLMALQQSISEELAALFIGKTLKVIVDRKEGEYFICRSEYSSPEVDPEVLVKTDEELVLGCFYDVEITGSDEFDLYGIIAN